jgi:uncharacterized membrane protein
MRKLQIITIAIIILSFAIAIYLYPSMPERMASHWNEQGEVNGYMSRFWGLFFMPIFSVGLFLLFILLPRVDPMKKNVDKFRNYFDWFILVFFVFMFYIFMLTLAWNLGKTFNMTRMMLPAMAVLFFYCGVLIKKAKPNWFIGIRTPWTLSNETVWNKTHALGAKMFYLFAVFCIIAAFLEKYAFLLMFIPLILGTLYLVLYSYLEYRKIKK